MVGLKGEDFGTLTMGFPLRGDSAATRRLSGPSRLKVSDLVRQGEVAPRVRVELGDEPRAQCVVGGVWGARERGLSAGHVIVE